MPWLEDITYVHGETAAHCQDDVLEKATVKAAASHLLGKYANLARDAFSHESLADHSRKFAVLWRALEACTPEPYWRRKPKLHQMQELCEFSSKSSGLTAMKISAASWHNFVGFEAGLPLQSRLAEMP